MSVCTKYGWLKTFRCYNLAGKRRIYHGFRKVDIDNQEWTYSSHVIAGDYIFTSICTGWGNTIEEHVENVVLQLQKYLNDAKASSDDVVKVTATFKKVKF